MNLEPLGHRVLVKLTEVEDKTTGGILLAKEYTEKEQKGMEEGEVIAIGSTAYKGFPGDESWVSVGDIVKFKRYEGVYLEEDGFSYRVLNDEDLFCRVTGESK